MIKVDNLQLIGRFSVDSGQAIVGDPCYLDDWKHWSSDSGIDFDDHENKAGEYGYLGACNATLGKGYGELNNGSAVAFSTGYGDGYYPVYAHINDDGRVGMVVIDFTGEYFEDEE